MVMMTFSNSSFIATSVWFRSFWKKISKKLIQGEAKIKWKENEIRKISQKNSAIMRFEPPLPTTRSSAYGAFIIILILRVILNTPAPPVFNNTLILYNDKTLPLFVNRTVTGNIILITFDPGWGLNPRPSACKFNALPRRHKASLYHKAVQVCYILALQHIPPLF